MHYRNRGTPVPLPRDQPVPQLWTGEVSTHIPFLGFLGNGAECLFSRLTCELQSRFEEFSVSYRESIFSLILSPWLIDKAGGLQWVLVLKTTSHLCHQPGREEYSSTAHTMCHKTPSVGHIKTRKLLNSSMSSVPLCHMPVTKRPDCGDDQSCVTISTYGYHVSLMVIIST